MVWNGQRDANGISDSVTDQLFESDSGFDHAIGRHSRFGDTQVQRDVWPRGGKSLIYFDNFSGV